MKPSSVWPRFAAVFLLLTALLSAQEPRLANISSRAQVGTGANVLTAGFVIGPGADKKVLIRAVGPTLALNYGLTSAMADPVLTLFNGANAIIATNDNWNSADDATMSSVGAFPLVANSKDAALVVTLAPGSYTAQINGAGNTTGVSLAEVYEVGATTSRLVNLSSRAQVGTGANLMIPGIVVSAGSGTRRFLVRAAGPALAQYVGDIALADPVITITDQSGKTTYATNDNWSTPTGGSTVSATTMSNAFSAYGAFPFAANSKDAAIFADLAPGGYTVQVSGAGGTSGLTLVEVYDTTPASPPSITVAATKAAADESGSNNGEFTFTRSGDTLSSLTVTYSVGGSAVNGFDYATLSGTITFPVGASTVKLPLLPNPDLQNEGTDSVVVTVLNGSTYTVGSQGSATVTIADSPSTLYVATVRPTTAAVSGSTASGTAAILLSQSGTLAAVTVTFSNLSSVQNTAYLTIGPNDDFVFNMPKGQVNGVQWYFTPVGNYSSAALLDALKSGNISVRIDTGNFPTGEIKGTFLQSSGVKTFTPPAAPPAVALTNVTANDAARLLTQATFGPTRAEIDALTGGSIDAWITAQLALPFTSHRTATVADRTAFGGSGSVTNWNAIHPPNRQIAWWTVSLTAPDQLRQRVAFALSQILVVSDVALGEDNQAEPLAAYYDMLGAGAFGNFRTLLENVTRSPLMGLYLSSLRNAKADAATGQTPDENYAREVMQLFTIGLSQLNPDGTLQLGADGLPVATYNQSTITEMAKVFTGWSYFTTNPTTATFRSGSRDYYSPMTLFSGFHDDTAKNLSPVLPTPIPAAQGGTRDLQLALDALFTHANTASFISKQLIQRLVTSNPSPGYVYRVAQKFENNGSGTRGDLAAVVRAILTDYEARSPVVAASASYGKLKEPILRLSGLLRSLRASSSIGRFAGYRNTVNGTPVDATTANPGVQTAVTTINAATRLESVQGSIAQAALRSPTVFNFYHPDYVLPGDLARAGLVAPEFEITDDNFAINVPNYLRNFVLATVPTTTAGPYTLTLNTTTEQALVATPSALLDHLNLLLCAGNMPAATKTRITTALAALPTSATTLDRVNTAILLTLTAPASAVQK